jgi:sulfite reductase alpha subunit-like flavoprotein
MRQLLILYGSQTGIAREYGERVAREAYHRGVDYTFMGMQEYDINNLQSEHFVVLLASTTGDGETPDNMRSFWQGLLRADLPHDWLLTVRCAVMGLGDSSYEKFCYVGKRLHRRLEQLGAKIVGERADGDEQHPLGLDGVFLPWCQNIFKEGAKLFGWREEALNNDKSEPAISLIQSNVDGEKISSIFPLTGGGDQTRSFHPVTIACTERITPKEHFQDVHHIVFRGQNIPNYKPGDVAILMPENPSILVDELIELLGWPADVTFKFAAKRVEVWVPDEEVTLRTLLKKFVDITAPPKRYFFEVIAQFVDPSADESALHREKLLELSKDVDLYLEYVWKPKRTPFEVLSDFMLKIPKEFVLDLFPRLRTREYSISSASSAYPGEVHVTAALVKYRAPIVKTIREGVCSRWLAGLVVGEEIVIGIRSGTWIMPPIREPIIMIAAGTGVAPMRAIIQDTNCGELYLFYGCRYLDADFHYQLEWRKRSNLRVFAMGSRDQPGSRRYIDKLLFQHSEMIRTLLPRAYIYVAGNSRLPSLVKKTLAEIGEDPNLPAKLVKAGRLQIEAWS